VSIVMQGLVYAAPNMTIAILVASTLLNSLIQAAIQPFDSAVVALMYTDLRMRSEGLDVELRRAAGV
jgi:putative membrane protein